MWTGTATMEKSTEVLQKTKNRVFLVGPVVKNSPCEAGDMALRNLARVPMHEACAP